jgi:hypothetical protein
MKKAVLLARNPARNPAPITATATATASQEYHKIIKTI